jgi:hypothetical protein
MTHHPAETQSENLAQLVQDVAAAEMLFGERLLDAQAAFAASWIPHTPPPAFDERPSVSARRQDWVAG